MIPAAISSSCNSPGERDIFNRLKSDPATREWIVLHSLDIAHHSRQLVGEADFVIIIPAVGVLCLEVKACRTLRREDGMWFYGQNPHGDPRGPFKQSSEAMHSLRRQVVQNDPTLSRVPFWSAVAFPYVAFSTTSDEWHSWQVIDATAVSRQPLPTLIRSILHNARSLLRNQPTSTWFYDTDRFPDLQQAAAIARILRPNFEYVERAHDRRARHQREILRFTEEQFGALDAMADNDRVFFTGPAGTGKTVLAMEAARRAADAGKSVLFVCYNRLLGKWLSQQPDICPRVTASTFHQYLMSVAGIIPPPDADDSFWRHQLPDQASTRLLSGHSDLGRFDTLVIDEFQDLAEPAFLDIFDAIVRGGLKSGHCLIFGDFERQMLYGQNRDQIDGLISARIGNFVRYSVRVNCRNTPRIAALSYLLGRLAPDYSRILRPDDQMEPQIVYYAKPSQQRRELSAALDRLKKESFDEDDIVVLSPKAGPRCAAASLEEPWSSRLIPIDQSGPGRVPYTTIQSFKGLESPAIVVTDIEHLDGELFSSLFYVATTRALERLCIIVHETAKPDITAALTGKPTERT